MHPGEVRLHVLRAREMLTEVLFVAVGGPSVGGKWEQWKRGSLKCPARARRNGVREQSLVNILCVRK